ncbi:MAG: 4a-hydroxytetrahydrobiopterin dehydratase [Polyangiaceae bacterium]|nr:4a-hydroxytetrahydrobiopterin dehydratase [Polyangiaceae bacterium]
MSRMADSDLSRRSCVACQGGVPALSAEVQNDLLKQLNAWGVVDGHHLSRDFRFSNFQEALAFVNQAGEVAEVEGHHPEMTVGWGHVLVEIWTHKIDGLTESDFILAAKLDQLEE